ncbi:MAG: hypothetical protein M1832_001155 [Thelocarpon impressellum]|nr:MAG: hypothetical protein M1832_001155 [Thelocarpon impressellum]
MDVQGGAALADTHEAEALTARFRRGMLTREATRFIDEAVRDLPGWGVERVQSWVEHEKGRISARNRLDEVSALAEALRWAVKNRDPDPSDPAGHFYWPGDPDASSLASHDEGSGERVDVQDVRRIQSSIHPDLQNADVVGLANGLGKTFAKSNGKVLAVDPGPWDQGDQAPSDDHFAGLLKAVTNAAGQEAARRELPGATGDLSCSGRPRRATRQSNGPQVRAGTLVPRAGVGEGQHHEANIRDATRANAHELHTALGCFATSAAVGTRKRKSAPFPSSEPGLDRTGGAAEGDDASLGDPSASELLEPDYQSHEDASTLEIRERPPQVAVSDARAVGVHSAAALFRRHSSSNRKYTRPPMSKLFTSLELSTEAFLQLQAAAKAYMLDAGHPARRECVGSRSRGDLDMVKLRLYNCVREFLEREGHGERFFGAKVQDGVPERKLVWPAQKQSIIAAVTPLLRRMVTNERQRQYAVDTRAKGVTSSKTRMADEIVSDERSLKRHDAADLESSPQAVHASLHANKRRAIGDSPGPPASKRASVSSAPDPPGEAPSSISTTAPLQIHLNILSASSSSRIVPRIDLSLASCPTFVELRHQIAVHSPLPEKPFSVQALTAKGLMFVDGTACWVAVVHEVRQCAWLDGELKVVVHLPYP